MLNIFFFFSPKVKKNYVKNQIFKNRYKCYKKKKKKQTIILWLKGLKNNQDVIGFYNLKMY